MFCSGSGLTISRTPRISRTVTCAPTGTTAPSALRADQSLPSTLTAPVPLKSLISSVTRAGAPMTRSALVGWLLLLTNFRASGRVSTRDATLTTANKTSRTDVENRVSGRYIVYLKQPDETQAPAEEVTQP